jgi:hypothetical protein
VHVLAVFLALSIAFAQTPSADPLSRARLAYNEHRYEDAIAAAKQAAKLPGQADAANLVTARSLLERSRESVLNAADLPEARRLLKAVDPGRLSPRDGVEFQVGLGEALYLENNFSAAAEFFANALERSAALDSDAREMVFEWWATNLDRQAQFGPPAERRPLYARILERADKELARRDTSAVASYWLAAAAQGVEDLERAWGAAQAGWIRGGQLGARGAQLRIDIDRLVMQVILPERARRLTAEGDPRLALASFIEEWEALKARWGRVSISVPAGTPNQRLLY